MAYKKQFCEPVDNPKATNKRKIKLLQRLSLIPTPSVVKEPYCIRRGCNRSYAMLVKYNCLERRKKLGMRIPCEWLRWFVEQNGLAYNSGVPPEMADLMGWNRKEHHKKVKQWYVDSLIEMVKPEHKESFRKIFDNYLNSDR